jgi:hypothetical protein
MRPKLLLRLSALLVGIHLLGHAFGHFSWKDTQGDRQKQDVIRYMTDYKFDFMGAARSMGEYYEGYSALILIKYLVFVLLLWAISNFAEAHPNISRNLIAPLALGLVAFGILEFVYFFPFAAIISMLAGLTAFFSMMMLKPRGN